MQEKVKSFLSLQIDADERAAFEHEARRLETSLSDAARIALRFGFQKLKALEIPSIREQAEDR